MKKIVFFPNGGKGVIDTNSNLSFTMGGQPPSKEVPYTEKEAQKHFPSVEMMKNVEEEAKTETKV